MGSTLGRRMRYGSRHCELRIENATMRMTNDMNHNVHTKSEFLNIGMGLFVFYCYNYRLKFEYKYRRSLTFYD